VAALEPGYGLSQEGMMTAACCPTAIEQKASRLQNVFNPISPRSNISAGHQAVFTKLTSAGVMSGPINPSCH
jgi:hypothetical protein